MSFLKIFNLKTIDSYLHHCFCVVTGCSVTEDDDKAFVIAHHVMKNAKDDIKTQL